MRKTLKTVLVVVLICVLLIDVALVISMKWDTWFGKAPVEENDAGGMPVPVEVTPVPTLELALDPNAGEYVAPVASQAPEDDGISIPGWGSITIPAGRTDVTVEFRNPESNEGKYYLTFELRLRDTGEVLYKSGLVEPGLYVQKITLTREMEAGEYDAVVHVQPYTMDDKRTPTNNADIVTKLIVVAP